MTQATAAAAAYRRNAILTASPEKLVKLLYDGAIRHLERSRVALSDPARTHSAEVGESLGKAIGIIGELRTALDHEVGGQIAHDLERLYLFGIDQLSTANLERRPQPVENTLRVMRTLKEGWDAVIPE
jgi:flagellar protein FliS